ncbi:MAG: ParM/StbA family protein [Sulfobacillus sp.]|nr:ParM/StbA family protein [Sulfobacillus sp.]
MKIAIDVGHGFTKAVSERQRVFFPSLIAPAPTGVDLGEYAANETVRIDGSDYLVGDAARRHATPLWSRDKAADQDTLRLVLVAAARLGATGPVTVATGLPLSWFGGQRRALREALTGYGGTVALPGRPAQRVWFDAVMVLPQGVAAATAVLAGSEYRAGTYVVADIGYRTTDYVVVEKTPGSQITADPTQAGSLELGTHAVAATIAAELERETEVPFSAAEVEDRDQVFVYGTAVSLAERRRIAQAAVAQQLKAQLHEALDARLAKVGGIILVGGGAEFLKPAFPQAIIPVDAQWANAVAYWSAVGSIASTV